METVRFEVGGIQLDVPLLTIRVLRRDGVWRAVSGGVPEGATILDIIDSYVAVLEAALADTATPMSADEMRAVITPAHLRDLDDRMRELYRRSGLLPPEGSNMGEAPAADPLSRAA